VIIERKLYQDSKSIQATWQV